MKKSHLKIGDLIKYAYYPVPIYSGNFNMHEHFGVVLDNSQELLYIIYSFTDDCEHRILKDDILCTVF